jgi:hypothetical protein
MPSTTVYSFGDVVLRKLGTLDDHDRAAARKALLAILGE